MELCDCACLVCLQILQVETADDVIFTPDVLRHQVYLSHTSSCYSLEHHTGFRNQHFGLSINLDAKTFGLGPVEAHLRVRGLADAAMLEAYC